MLMLEPGKLAWWYWLATVCLLTAGLLGYHQGFWCAIALTGVQLLHYVWRERRIGAFSVQVRAWYLALLLAAIPEPLQALYWLPTVGTWALVLFGYCGMARFVSLLPWNRRGPLTVQCMWRTFVSRPVRGSIQASDPKVADDGGSPGRAEAGLGVGRFATRRRRG
jgi:hypothetical protein